MSLVERSDLAAFLQRPVVERTADLAVQLVEGWLRPLVRSIPWPPDRTAHPDLWSAAVELAGMVVDNPTSMRSSVVGGQTDEWTVARRSEILTEVASRYGAVAPLGSFPPPEPWPAPATSGWWR